MLFGPHSPLLSRNLTQGDAERVRSHSLGRRSAQSSSSSSSSSGSSKRALCFRQVWRQFTTVRWKCWMLWGSLRTWPASGYSCSEQLASAFTSRLRSSALCWKWTLASGDKTHKRECTHKSVAKRTSKTTNTLQNSPSAVPCTIRKFSSFNLFTSSRREEVWKNNNFAL